MRVIEFINDSGASIPPYAAMRVSGYEQSSAETTNRVLLKVSKPDDSELQSVCFNGRKTVAAGGKGKCTFDFPCYANVESAGSNGDRYDIEEDSFKLAASDDGPFIYLATVAAGPNGETIALIDRAGNGGGTRHSIFGTLDGTLTSGGLQTIAVHDWDGAAWNPNGDTKTVYELLGLATSVDAGTMVWAEWEHSRGVYVVTAVSCA